MHFFAHFTPTSLPSAPSSDSPTGSPTGSLADAANGPPSGRPLGAFAATLCLLWACAGLCAAPTAQASVAQPPTLGTVTPTAQPPQPARPRVALVLSGGGARGFAHVGVLKALEQARVPVDMVVGTSMGAIIGGLYASGMSPDVLAQELQAVDWATLFGGRAPRQALSQRRKEEDFELSPVLQLGFRNGGFVLPSGAVSSQSLEWMLRRYTLPTRHLSSFDALPIAFRAVATDMETGQPVVLDRGDLAAALRASMSVPGVFAPLELDGHILGDGGLVNNLPVDVARQMGADVVIAVNIGTPLAGRDTLHSVLGVSAQMINILTEQNVQRSVAQLGTADLLLTPSLAQHTAADFDRVADIIGLGTAYAATVEASLARFAVNAADYASWQLQRTPLSEPTPAALAFVRLDGVPADRARHLASRMGTAPGQALDTPMLEADLQQLSANRDFGRVDYRLEPGANGVGEGLVVRLDENPLGSNFFRIGLDLNTDLQGDASFNIRINHHRRALTPSGTEWRNEVSLGNTTGLTSELFHPLGGDRDRFFSVHVGGSQTKVEVFEPSGLTEALVSRSQLQMGAEHGWTLGNAGQLGDARVGLFATRRGLTPELVRSGPQASYPSLHWTEAGLKASVVSDQLDHANFPQQGHRLRAQAQVGQRRTLGNTQSFNKLTVEATQAMSWGPHTLNLHARLARVTHVPTAAIEEYALGGFHQLSGYKLGQFSGNHTGLLRLGYYQRLGTQLSLARALFVGGTAEAGNAWASAANLKSGHLKTGYSLYVGADTAMGPVYLSLVHAPRGRTGLYFFIGQP